MPYFKSYHLLYIDNDIDHSIEMTSIELYYQNIITFKCK